MAMSNDAVIRDLIAHLPEGTADGFGNPQLAFRRLEEALTRELESAELAFTANRDGEVVVVSLEEKVAVLYRFVPPLTVSRELLHLRGAVVRHDIDAAGDEESRVSLKLRDETLFKLRVRERDNPAEIRDELEKRAAL